MSSSAMKVVRLDEIAGEHFPAGRFTRILAGVQSDLQPERFVVGYSVVHPGGGIPLHHHPNEEVYVVLSGQARLQVGGEETELTGVAAAYIPPDQEHALMNDSDDDAVLMFIYSPAGTVDHWEHERRGGLSMNRGESIDE